MRWRKPWKSLCDSLAEHSNKFRLEIDVESREESRCRAGVWSKKRADELYFCLLEYLGSEEPRVFPTAFVVMKLFDGAIKESIEYFLNVILWHREEELQRKIAIKNP